MPTLFDILKQERDHQSISKLVKKLGFENIKLVLTDVTLPWQLSFIVDVNRASGGRSIYSHLLEATLIDLLKVDAVVIVNSRVTDELNRIIVDRSIIPLDAPPGDITKRFKKNSLEDIILKEPDADLMLRVTDDLKRAERTMQVIAKTALMSPSQTIKNLIFYKPEEKQMSSSSEALSEEKRTTVKRLLSQISDLLSDNREAWEELEGDVQELKRQKTETTGLEVK